MTILFSLPGGAEWMIIALFFLVPLIALIDILRSTFGDSINKLVWLLVVVFLPVLGSVLYLAIGMGQKIDDKK